MRNRLNYERLELWIDQLRSDNFTQGKGKLKFREVDTGLMRHCCLGVGADLASIECQNSGVETLDEGVVAEIYELAACDTLAPFEFFEWLGIPDYFVVGSGDIYLDTAGVLDDDLESVATLNDQGWTFSQIADLIEYFGIRLNTFGLDEDIREDLAHAADHKPVKAKQILVDDAEVARIVEMSL